MAGGVDVGFTGDSDVNGYTPLLFAKRAYRGTADDEQDDVYALPKIIRCGNATDRGVVVYVARTRGFYPRCFRTTRNPKSSAEGRRGKSCSRIKNARAPRSGYRVFAKSSALSGFRRPAKNRRRPGPFRLSRLIYASENAPRDRSYPRPTTAPSERIRARTSADGRGVDGRRRGNAVVGDGTRYRRKTNGAVYAECASGE